MALVPTCHLGLWTNGFEEFFLQTEHTRFEIHYRPIGAWPAPGEGTEDVDRTGGTIQVSAEADDLQDVLERCHRFLNRNLGLDHKDTFRQLAVLLLAKIYDETRPAQDRRFWIRGDEPFTPTGQAEIKRRIHACLEEALKWQPGVLSLGWGLHLDEAQAARVVIEIARYSLSTTHPFDRTRAYRSIVRTVMMDEKGVTPLHSTLQKWRSGCSILSLMSASWIVHPARGLF